MLDLQHLEMFESDNTLLVALVDAGERGRSSDTSALSKRWLNQSRGSSSYAAHQSSKTLQLLFDNCCYVIDTEFTAPDRPGEIPSRICSRNHPDRSITAARKANNESR